MPVMDVGIVGVRMRENRMPMRMRVRLDAVPGEVVYMPVMRVVAMPVRVLGRLVRVTVRMPLAQVEPDAERHQRGGGPEGCEGASGQIASAVPTPNSGATAK